MTESRAVQETKTGRAAVASPLRVAWMRLRRNRTALIGGVTLFMLYLGASFGSFLSPYDPSAYDVTRPGHPPTLPRFVDEKGTFHVRPFVYGMKLADIERQSYKFDLSQKYPVRFFVRGHPYKLWWFLRTDRHLFGVDAPGIIAPLGRDPGGRDVFSRLLEGAKISLSIGLVGIALSTLIGMFMGGLAGYYGRATDTIIMRLVEFLLSIPTLYLIISLRAYFQTKGVFGMEGKQVGSVQLYWMIVIILSLVGWAGVARVVRGMVLSIKEMDFVSAERALGASALRIIWRHILPNTLSYVIISATISVPGFILGEVALSFLGVGIKDPQVSWGNMLEPAQSVDTMKNFPWVLFSPATAIFLTVMAFNFLGDGLRDALDPKHTK